MTRPAISPHRALAVVMAVAGCSLPAPDAVGLAPGRASDDVRCAQRHTHTLARTTATRIFHDSIYTYACVYATAHTFKLGPAPYSGPTELTGQRSFRFAGRYIAFENYAVGEQGGFFNVEVYDLRDGHQVHDAPTGRPSPDPGPQGVGLGHTTALILMPSGSVAWIAQVFSSFYNVPPEVHAVDHTGRRLLDRASDIGPHSLRLSGSTLTWLNADKRRSAVLH